MLHLILKAYKTSIVMHLSPHQQSAESLVPWGRLLFQVVNLQIPKEAVPQDEEDRERSEWWKAKKWAYGILGRLFNRFGNPSQLPTSMQSEYLAFAQHFVTTFAPEIFKIYLQQVELFVSGQAWLSRKCQYQIFSFFTEWSVWNMSIARSVLLIQPIVSSPSQLGPCSSLILRLWYPLTCTRSSASTLRGRKCGIQTRWSTFAPRWVRASRHVKDPINVRALDETETFDTPVSAATTFLLSLAANRTKVAFMPILGFMNRILSS